jgi:hypothetical protein
MPRVGLRSRLGLRTGLRPGLLRLGLRSRLGPRLVVVLVSRRRTSQACLQGSSTVHELRELFEDCRPRGVEVGILRQSRRRGVEVGHAHDRCGSVGPTSQLSSRARWAGGQPGRSPHESVWPGNNSTFLNGLRNSKSAFPELRSLGTPVRRLEGGVGRRFCLSQSWLLGLRLLVDGSLGCTTLAMTPREWFRLRPRGCPGQNVAIFVSDPEVVRDKR